MDICTIIACNYVPFARVLAESFTAHHPGSRCFALVVDDHHGRIDPAAEPFELISPGELRIEHFDRMAALYSVLELSTAVKPWLLRHLLDERGCEALAYFDPDIEIYDSLDEVDARIRRHGLVVTPHLTAPMPRDGKRPTETDILIAGSFNLGFLGLAPGPHTDELLDWWSERLQTDCVVAPEKGYFVDQRWMDFAPGLVPSFDVLRDPGYNVAYWNLPSRRVRKEGGRFTVDGRPLRFFHFSGFDPEAPDRLSKHQDRIDLADEPAVRELCERYAARLLERGYRNARRFAYGYDTLGDGTPLDAAVRRGYRAAVEAEALRGTRVFTPEGARELLSWLNGPADAGGDRGVTRYLQALWESRPDIQKQFPDIGGADAGRLVAWARVAGRATVPIPTPLVPGQGPEMTRVPLGVNVAGYFRSVMGVGEAGRRVVEALQANGVQVATIGLPADRSQQEPTLGPAVGGEPRYPVNLICVNADVLAPFAEKMGPAFFADRYSIGLWWWEVSSFPERWLPAFDHVDEVWVGSQHIADALTPISPVPVVKIRQPVAVPQPAALTRAQLGLPEGFLFLFSFDYNSVFERKNPLAVIDAFARAFPPGAGPQLVIKSINHEQDPENHARLVAAAAARDDVHLVERYVSVAERDAMTAACDCYVSLHRSEGFGFTVAEAMALGRPVIATAYSGTMEMTTPRNSYLVDHELVPIGLGAAPYPPDGEWAEPDLDHAAALMREVVEHPQEARARGKRAARDIRARHSAAEAGRIMAERLQRVSWRGAPRHLGAPLTDTARLRERVEAGPPGSHTPRFGRAQETARKVLLRALKPYTVHERIVDGEIVGALEVLDRTVQALAAAVTRVEPARIDDLAQQVQELREEVRRVVGVSAAPNGRYPVAPEVPWSHEYNAAHRDFLVRALDDLDLLFAFKSDGELPAGYGVGFDERVVEFPWLLTRSLSGLVLDAGSTLNHPHILGRLRPRLDGLHIVTLTPEQQAFPFLDVSYLYADLRELPLADGVYDHVVCVSTLEHVGMDNSYYGAAAGRAEDPDAELRRAIGELRRVLRPGGVLSVTVPFGEPEDFGWQRIFALDGIERIEGWFGGADARRTFYSYTADGWRRSSAAESAGARYRDHFSNPAIQPDRAVAARAVACLQLRKPG